MSFAGDWVSYATSLLCQIHKPGGDFGEQIPCEAFSPLSTGTYAAFDFVAFEMLNLIYYYILCWIGGSPAKQWCVNMTNIKETLVYYNGIHKELMHVHTWDVKENITNISLQ